MALLSRRVVIGTIFGVLTVVTTNSTAEPQAYASITDLGALVPGGFSDASAVNDAGLVVGLANPDPSSNVFHATVWTDGVPRDLGTLCSAPCPFDAHSSASDVNELGQVVGNSEIADGYNRGFIWHEGEGMRILPPLEGDVASVAFGINNRGEAVGNSRRSMSGGDARPVMWTADGTPHELAGWTSGSALDVNDNEQIVGFFVADDGWGHASQWERGILTDLGGLPAACPGPTSFAYGINRFGHVAGVADMDCSSAPHAVKWVHRVIHDLGTVKPGMSYAASYDNINDAGDVVGYSPHPTTCPPTYGASRATLWKHGAIIDLGSLSDSPCASSTASAVNNHGLVVGNSATATGQSHAVVYRLNDDLARGAFGGIPRPIPGRIEAEDYDVGGQGVGYFDTTTGNEQGAFVYRADDVDIKPSREGGHAVGWFAAGEWLVYTVNVKRDGLYSLHARVGSALPGRTFHVEVDGRDVTGPIPVPQLREWDRYRTVRVEGVSLHKGTQVLRVVMGPEDFMDLQWIALVGGNSVLN